MKSLLKFTFLFCTLALYGLVVNHYNSSSFSSNEVFLKSNADNTETYFSLVSSNLFCHTNQNESFTDGPNHFLPQHSLKNYLNNFSKIIYAKELILENKFVKYDFYSRNIILRLQHSDIIYPFHYFW